MAKIDAGGWKPFAMRDLGFSNFHGERLNKAARIEGSIPFVTAGFDNRGIAQNIGNDRPTYHKAISIDMFGNCFFQPNDCAGDDNVYFFVNDDVSDYCKLFIAACINTDTSKRFAYVEQFRQPNADALSVTLPVDASGEPDWAYMEEYMSVVMKESEVSLESLKQADGEKHAVDIVGWKEFPIGGEHGLFDVVKGSRLTKAAMREGTINFISASSFNNGIAAHVENNEHVHPGNTLTVSYNGSDIGRTFYQKEPFWASDDVNVLYPRFEMNECIALFLSPLIKEAGGSHVYKNKWLQTDMMNTMIPLPVTEGGNPDWAYMDEYMRAVMNNTQADLSAMQAIG